MQHDILSDEECVVSQEEGFDIIVSNPPYIKQCERLQMERNVLDWEPELALFVPDDDPLLFYRTIVRRAANGLLKPGGRLYFEINREHGADTIALMEEAGFVQVELLKDLSGNERIVKGGLV
jgi:release factor glutamine methyltransferase